MKTILQLLKNLRNAINNGEKQRAITLVDTLIAFFSSEDDKIDAEEKELIGGGK